MKRQLTSQIGINHWSGDRILTRPYSPQLAPKRGDRSEKRRRQKKGLKKEGISKQIPRVFVVSMVGLLFCSLLNF